MVDDAREMLIINRNPHFLKAQIKIAVQLKKNTQKKKTSTTWCLLKVLQMGHFRGQDDVGTRIRFWNTARVNIQAMMFKSLF